MYLCHYDNDQNGPNFGEGKRGGEGGGASGSTKPQNWKKIHLKPQSIQYRWQVEHKEVSQLWRQKDCRSDRGGIGTQTGKAKTTSDSKSENPLVFLTKTENQVPKFGNPRTTINTKTVKPKFVRHKTEKPI